MTHYDYKVVPAPERGEKAPGVRTPEARFAWAVERLMNDMAAEGWEFQRGETLPSEERSGLTKTVTRARNLLVFRKARAPHSSEDAGLAAAGLTLETPGSAGLGAAGLRLTEQEPGETPAG